MISIRRAVPDEITELAQVGVAAWRRGIAPHVPDHVVTKIERDNPFLPFLNEMKSRVLVAVIDGKPAGIGAREGDDCRISDIWVAPSFEGRGVGSALVRKLEAEILERRYSHAEIEVAAANTRALRLYLHLGYHQTWRKTLYDPILEFDLEKVGLTKEL